jgi:GntR family transcriptional repressor for pyruvate dehydrogenase complex
MIMTIDRIVDRAGRPEGSTSPLVAERLSDRLAALLAAQVETGAMVPGDRLPTEHQLSAAHGVSRTVVREAVHQLKSRGLLRSRQGSGVYVAVPALNQSLAFDTSVLESMTAVVQIVEVRRALEGEIAALAAERASRSQIAGLRRSLATIEGAVAAGRDGVAEDLAFHHAIAEASGNPQFSRLLGFLEQYLREAMRVTRGNEARYLDFMDEVRAEHRAIVEAIAAHDAAAARRMAAEHMLRAAQRLQSGGVIGTSTSIAPRRPSVQRSSARSVQPNSERGTTRAGRRGSAQKGIVK